MRKHLLVSLVCCSLAAFAADTYTRDDFLAAYQQYETAVDEGREDDALNHAKEALEIGIAVLGKDDPNIANLEYNYGYQLLIADDLSEASRHLHRALRGFEEAHGEDAVELINPLIDLIRAEELGDLRRQSVYARRIKQIAVDNYGEDSEQYAQTLLRIGTELLSIGSEKSGTYLLEAQEKAAALSGTDGLGYGYVSFFVGKYYLAARSNKKAIDEFETALAIFDKFDDFDTSMELMTRAFLVEALETTGRSEEATQHCLAIGEMSPGRDLKDLEPIFRKTPVYPPTAASTGKQGRVLVEFDVTEMGFVRNPTVVEVYGNDVFRKAALEAVEDFRYAPRFEGGEPVTTRGVQHIIAFSLVD